MRILLEEIADAALDGKRKERMELLATVPLLIIDDLGMRKLGATAAEELLEIVMRLTSAPARCSLPIALSRTGENCSATAPRSPPCSTVYSTTAISSNADRVAGGRRWMRLSTSITTSPMARDTPNHDGHSRECNRLITPIEKADSRWSWFSFAVDLRC
jgi:hypothetical protein